MTEQQQTMRIFYSVNPRSHLAAAYSVGLQVESLGERSPFAYVAETFSPILGLSGVELTPESKGEGHSDAPVGLLNGDLVRMTERRGHGQKEEITREGIYQFHEESLFVVHERGFSLHDYHHVRASNLWDEEAEHA